MIASKGRAKPLEGDGTTRSTPSWLRWLSTACFFLLASCPGSVRAEVDFERDIEPILSRRCVACHHAHDAQGGLNLSSAAGLQSGGESGPAVVAGDPSSSLLWQRVEAGEMPAAAQGQTKRLPDEEIQRLRDWIAAGAAWPVQRTIDPYEHSTPDRAGRDWWALQPLQPIPVPTMRQQERVATPVDAFVLQTLEQHGRQPAPLADRRTLVRRVYFDLLGLPPSWEQIEAFAADDSPQAYERLLDQLLASPRYGERWGRYWLDLVRFAETCGYERDQVKPNLWRYRDWVIQAFNEDMPYDRFVTEQLAGDEVAWRNESTVIATGMLRAGTWNDEPNDPADYLYERLEDMVHTTTSAFLGLTVKCARCHDHKFDPIRQTDYYRLASFFWVGHLGQAHLGGPSKEELGYDVFGWTDRGRETEPIRWLRAGQRLNPADEVPPGFLSAVPHLDRPLDPPPSDSHTTQRRLQFARWLTDPQNPLTARVFVNRLWQHHFGEALVRTPNNFGLKSDPPTHPQLLDWLAGELQRGEWQLKRVHRLIMLSTTYRQASTHPEETRYAQEDFTNRSLWRAMRRRLDAEALRDRLLTASGQLQLEMGGPSFTPHMSDEALEGLSRKGSDWQESPADQQARRSVYMFTKRSLLLPLMTAFDFSDTTLSCAQRDVTTVAPQALAMLNNEFVHAQSQQLAQRVIQHAGQDREAQIEFSWRFSLGRSPSSEERGAALAHLQQQREHFADSLREADGEEQLSDGNRPAAERLALASLCHVLLNTNEFLYVD
jgi:hypothetical protein